MDWSLVVSIVVSIVAIVPGVLALLNQSRKDRIQSNIDVNKSESDMNKVAQEAAISIISPLRDEVGRLQDRILELEQALVNKTIEIGELMKEGIDKDAKIRILEYQLEEMGLRLQTFEKGRKTKGGTGNTVPIQELRDKIEEEQKEIEVKKEEIRTYTQETIKQITNGSGVNQTQQMEVRNGLDSVS